MREGVFEYAGLTAVMAIIAHAAIRRYFIACTVAAAVTSFLNLLHGAWLADFDVNLGWAPPLYLAGFLVAFPVAALVGLPFHVWRQKEGTSRVARQENPE